MNASSRRGFLCLVISAALLGCSERAADRDDTPREDLQVWTSGTLGPLVATVRGPGSPEGPFAFAGRITVEVELEVAADAELEAPVFGARLGDLRIRRTRNEGGVEDRKRVWRFAVDNERSGENLLVFPSFAFSVLSGEGAGERRTLALDPVSVFFAEPGSDEVVDLATLARAPETVALPPRPVTGVRWWWWALGALVVIGGLGWWLGRRGTTERVAPPIDPRTEARSALEALLAGDLLANEDWEGFFVALTMIVRRYIERTRGINAPDLTTSEFIAAAARVPDRFPAERLAELERFLETADIVKYAAGVPDQQDIDGAVAEARRFCELDGSARSSEVAA